MACRNPLSILLSSHSPYCSLGVLHSFKSYSFLLSLSLSNKKDLLMNTSMEKHESGRRPKLSRLGWNHFMGALSCFMRAT